MSEEEVAIEFEAEQGPPEQRILGIYGEVDEESTQDFLGGLLHYHHTCEGPPDEDGIIPLLPIDFYISTGGGGSLHNIEAGFKEAEILEKMMFEAIAAETKLNMRKIKKIVSKNLDAYFSAEEAVEMGIADIIV